ncbi:S9 family peptidase [Actinacidiphila glaucinigra]|uniref:S9 family peptidase n=1 Tax=Actinacidiphila glaucinigra TaxID=235986 RepID=UPI0038634476
MSDRFVDVTMGQEPHVRTHHGDRVVDEFAWLSDTRSPVALRYLRDENDRTDRATEHLATLRESISAEIGQRARQADSITPVRTGSYWYFDRVRPGDRYPVYCRLPVQNQDAPPDPASGIPLPGEQMVLDVNALADGHDYAEIGVFDLTPDGRLLAYSVDYLGEEVFTLRVKDLAAGEDLPVEIPGTSYGSAWSSDGSALFYVKVDRTGRRHQVWRHRVSIGEPDALVYQEDDPRFWVSVGTTRSGKYVLIESHAATASEIRYLPADHPLLPLTVLGAGRAQGCRMQVEHQDGRFLVLHNAGMDDFVLDWAPETDTSNLQRLVEPSEGTSFVSIDAFAEHVVLEFRRQGVPGFRVIPRAGSPYDVVFPEPAFSAEPDLNPDYRAPTYRVRYQSLATPDTLLAYDIPTGEATVVSRRHVSGGFDPSCYEQHRTWATAPDGTQVPISLVCRSGMPRDGSAPLVMVGYGSYGSSLDPWFSASRLSLLDRGIVFALAHVRGGGELGPRWHDEGRGLRKPNTFHDFLASARHLIDTGWTSAGRIIARGRSAGGLLVGAVVNTAPELFAGVVAEAPFVDPLTTMLDPSQQLTPAEWEEWGDPLTDPEAYHCIKSYAPYENVSDLTYPPVLSVAALNDPRVAWREPAKWIARLRAVGSGGPFLLRTDFVGGHGGPSDRHGARSAEAFVLAWIIHTATAAAKEPVPTSSSS